MCGAQCEAPTNPLAFYHLGSPTREISFPFVDEETEAQSAHVTCPIVSTAGKRQVRDRKPGQFGPYPVRHHLSFPGLSLEVLKAAAETFPRRKLEMI